MRELNGERERERDGISPGLIAKVRCRLHDSSNYQAFTLTTLPVIDMLLGMLHVISVNTFFFYYQDKSKTNNQ